MNAAVILLAYQQAQARVGRADVKPRWRKITGHTPRRQTVRGTTAALRSARYDD